MKWCFLAIAACLAMPSYSKEMSLLVDVSGSMARYGPWQDEALSLVQDVLNGHDHTSDTIWKLIGSAQTLSEFSMSSGDRLHLVLFGSVSSHIFPYFRTLDLSGTADLDKVFPRSQSLFREARTNKLLAIAVGARLAARNGGMAELIVISDFLNDSDLNDSEREFFNQFDSEAEQSSPVTFSWNRDSRVQVKLMQARLPLSSSVQSTATQVPSVPRSGSLQLFTPQPLAGGRKAMRFRWRLSDAAGLVGYTLDILDQATRRSIVHRAGLIAPAFTWTDAPGGRYRWRVAATFEDQSQVTSPLVSFSVPSSGINPSTLLFLMSLAGAAAAALCGVRRWKARKAAAEAPHRPDQKSL